LLNNSLVSGSVYKVYVSELTKDLAHFSSNSVAKATNTIGNLVLSVLNPYMWCTLGVCERVHVYTFSEHHVVTEEIILIFIGSVKPSCIIFRKCVYSSILLSYFKYLIYSLMQIIVNPDVTIVPILFHKIKSQAVGFNPLFEIQRFN
jgi:hypothetical protein